MDKQISEKLEALQKYVPFIDFIIEKDKGTHVKFIDIRKWIVERKRYPLSDLDKIEQSLIKQYKNMTAPVHTKFPPEIIQIFCKKLKLEYVDLCSDDEDNNAAPNNSSTKNDGAIVNIESDDDLEIVSISHPSEEKGDGVKQSVKDTSAELLSQIDKKNAEPNNYHEEPSDRRELLQRRTPPSLFKRRDDVEPSANKREVTQNENIKLRERNDSPSSVVSPGVLVDTISLASSDEETLPDAPPTVDLGERNSKLSVVEKPMDSNDDSLLLTRHSQDRNTHIEADSVISSIENTNSVSNLNDIIKVVEQPNFHKHNTFDDKSGNVQKSVSSIDLSSVENFNIEELINCIIKIDETKNDHLDKSLLLKTFLRRLCHNDDNSTVSISAQSANETIPAPPEMSAAPLFQSAVSQQHKLPIHLNPRSQQPQEMPYQHPFGYQQPVLTYNDSQFSRIQALTNQHKLNLNDPRIRNFLNKLKNSPLLTAPEKELARKLGNFMPQVGNIGQNIVQPAAINQAALNIHHSVHLHSVPQGHTAFRPQTQIQNNCGTPEPSSAQSITLEEYKRRNAEEQLRAEHQREYERKLQENEIARQEVEQKRLENERRRQEEEKRRQEDEKKRQQEFDEIEKRDIQRKTDEIRHILQNTLQPYEGKIVSMRGLQKTTIDVNDNKNHDDAPDNGETAIVEKILPTNEEKELNNRDNCAKKDNTSPINAGEQLRAEHQRENERKLQENEIARKEVEQKRQENERRRQEEEKRRQEDEKKRQQEFEEMEKRDTQRKADEIRHILQNTPQPYEGKIVSMRGLQKTTKDGNDNKNHDDAPDNGETAIVEKILPANEEKELNNRDNCAKKDNTNPINRYTKTKGKKKDDTTETSKTAMQEKKIIDRVNRAIKGLECTFKGYDQICDYIPRTVGGKRRSGVQARSAIADQLTSVDDTDISLSQSTNDSSSCQFTQSKRRKNMEETQEPSSEMGGRPSSLRTRSAISEQIMSLNNSDDICSSQSTSVSCEYLSTSQSTIESLQSFTAHRRKNIVLSSEVRKPRSSANARSAIAKQLSEQPHDDVQDIQTFRSCTPQKRKPIVDRRLKETIMHKKQPYVKLKRLTDDEIRKHTQKHHQIIENNYKTCNVLNVQLVESSSHPDTTDVATKTIPKALPKRLNNDCEMTESNTNFCMLCSSKPSDLTNHYVRKHKSESYVSRLTWSQLDELCINTPIAKGRQSATSRITRYTITCPFCDEELVEPFMSLFNHYSSHTGEYAFQCSGCHLQKPYRADIQSHQLHSKTCRGSRVQNLYLYPPDTMVIYLHYCTICNFVQLNEANILRHLRDHHDPRQSTTKNVQKCILAAISDGPDTQIANNSNDEQLQGQSHNFEIEPKSKWALENVANDHLSIDNNIPVCNEACSEEPIDSASVSLGEQLKEIQEEPMVKTTAVPMTVIHLDPTMSSNESAVTPPKFKSMNVPKIFKPEPVDIEESRLLTPPKPRLQESSANQNSSSRITYRSYPANVRYMFLYKCMADDCYYSTDLANELLIHLEDHKRENAVEYLDCAYCTLPDNTCTSPQQLVDHIGMKHSHMIFQCSICCYRSCDASNVSVHQKVNHADKACKIYKCCGTERAELNDVKYLNEKKAENVRKIQCPYCSQAGFYHSNLLENHIKIEHKMLTSIKNYSCMYCPFFGNEACVVRKHLAFEHPDENPYLCSHNNTEIATDDLLDNLKPRNMAEHKTCVIEMKSSSNSDGHHESKCPVNNIKPRSEELLKCLEESVRLRLRKLTELTGVSPDNLYHCPEPSCGGFFSIYNLWSRHMRVRHHCVECRCPHCSIDSTRSLEEYEVHFEEHRRHTFICFHCAMTFASSKEVYAHASTEHVALGPMRLEQIRFNLNYSYYVMIQRQILTNRLEFVQSLLICLKSRLKELANSASKNLKRCWLASTHSSTWLDDYLINISRKFKKKCFNGNCDFRAMTTEDLFKHVRENHNITGSTFKCFQCDFNLQNCRSWDKVLNHIQQHSDNGFFICGTCLSHYYTRSKLAGHIREMHGANDVPIINLVKKKKSIYLSLAMVFANECLSFSTLRDCFCCAERDMNGDAFILHLERYHKLILNYFCEWCNLPIESRQSATEHFHQHHTRNKLKIRCELASESEISVVSVRNLKLHIDNGTAADECKSPVGNDEVARSQKRIESCPEKPNTGEIFDRTKLLNSRTEDTSSMTMPDQIVSLQPRVFPRIKIVPIRQLSANDLVRPSPYVPTTAATTLTSTTTMQCPSNEISILSHSQIIRPKSNSIQNPVYEISTHQIGPHDLSATQNSAATTPVMPQRTDTQVMYPSTTISTCFLNTHVNSLKEVVKPAQRIYENGLTNNTQRTPQVQTSKWNYNGQSG